jgi:3-oxoadipate enol-lactonase
MSQPIMVSLPSVEIATYLDGEEGRPWIVLSNSLGATHAMWEPQLELLTANYRVLRYDTRGHGRSSAPPAPYSLGDLVGDVIGILDHHRIDSADMLGLSLGGTTMMRLAIAHPERVRKQVICDASADTEPADIDRWDRRIAQVMSDGTSSLGDELLGRWYTQAFRDAHPDIMAWSLEMLGRVSATGYAGCAAALKDIHLLQGLPSLQAQTLYISGAQDGHTPAKMADMAEITPNAQFMAIDPGAHFPNVESAVLFNHILLEFYNGSGGSDERSS